MFAAQIKSEDSSTEIKLAKQVVMSGGIVLGIQLIGVLRALQEYPELYNHIDSIAGTSVGAFAAVCAALNISALEVEELLLSNEIDLAKFIDPVFDEPFSDALPKTNPSDPHLVAAVKSVYKIRLLIYLLSHRLLLILVLLKKKKMCICQLQFESNLFICEA